MSFHGSVSGFMPPGDGGGSGSTGSTAGSVTSNVMSMSRSRSQSMVYAFHVNKAKTHK